MDTIVIKNFLTTHSQFIVSTEELNLFLPLIGISSETI